MVDCHFGFGVAGVLDGCRFEEHHFDFMVGYGAMLDSTRNYYEIAFGEGDGSVAELHSEASAYDKEELVFGGVIVPDELALELDELDVLAVEFADDAGIPVIGE